MSVFQKIFIYSSSGALLRAEGIGGSKSPKIAIFYMRVAGMRCGKGSEVCKVLFWARVASVWSPSEARVLKKPQVTRKDTLHISDPFSAPNLGTPNIEYYFFKLHKHFRTPPHGVSGGTMSRPLPTWPRPLSIATPTKPFSSILRTFYYIIHSKEIKHDICF